MTFDKVIAALIATPLLIVQQACLAQSTITVDVTLQTPTGAGIPDAPCQVSSTVDTAFAMTNASGQATFALEIAEGESTVMVRMTSGGFEPIVPPALRDQAINRFHTLRKLYSFKGYYLFPVEGDTVNATIATDEAVTISGRFVDAAGSTAVATVGVRDRNSFDFVDEVHAGVFDLPGIPKGQAVEVWYGIDTQIHRLALTATQTAADTNIGDVTLVDTPADGSATILMENTANLQQPSKMVLDRGVLPRGCGRCRAPHL